MCLQLSRSGTSLRENGRQGCTVKCGAATLHQDVMLHLTVQLRTLVPIASGSKRATRSSWFGCACRLDSDWKPAICINVQCRHLVRHLRLLPPPCRSLRRRLQGLCPSRVIGETSAHRHSHNNSSSAVKNSEQHTRGIWIEHRQEEHGCGEFQMSVAISARTLVSHSSLLWGMDVIASARLNFTTRPRATMRHSMRT